MLPSIMLSDAAPSMTVKSVQERCLVPSLSQFPIQTMPLRSSQAVL